MHFMALYVENGDFFQIMGFMASNGVKRKASFNSFSNFLFFSLFKFFG